ncbi:uncharacterized protein DFL_005552 [Arthrobotrys flagrans]|uniref:Uncharacterized protein n=1 Tax=Arthrobotrys flagrans TaxID=97331 RepID=A0A436ZXR7_ARTFL|nr:hypothetical protein DFL_005552 [Arthrobotrys flagrans]
MSADLSQSQTSSYLGASTDPDHDVASLASESTERDESDAELEWQESIKQLEMLLTMVVVPFAGKWLGRRFWGKAMEWKYPVDVVITSKAEFAAGGVGAVIAASAPI